LERVLRMPFAEFGFCSTKHQDGVTSMDANLTAKTVRQLQRAEGYIELQLPDRALAELDEIRNADSFEAAIALLKGEALIIQKRFDEAAVLLKRAATMIPSPLNKRAWKSLSECYRQSGREEMAELADLIVNAEQSSPDSPTLVRVAIVPLRMISQALEQLLADLASRDGSGASEPNEP
jgi:tetratricopeptide (TPR) repeat protein